MSLVSAKTELRFTLLWVVATCGGFLLSLCLIEIGEKPDMGVAQAFLGGLAIALPQSLILRHTISAVKWILSTLLAWIAISAMGMGAIGWVIPSTQFLPSRILSGAIHVSIGGFGIGFAQWLAIRQPFPWAWQWILVSSASWAIAIPVGSIVGSILHDLTRLFLGEVVGLAITWLVVAILTGINAYRLFQ
ncbi:hypothetical protein I8751_29450 [Nostocaceae cyanobacterium CENA357]|uniref:Uncharacterized protein n=1 Tax=Atlanticothrix silvestris CENA357 TaxID=1725252 RepID=A0A8J7HQ70_9CYAN|nr:hypothetical protein [Atlanticothrix silvestris]MBH8556380.1 hypothetical protein [Atlanticothrix silvestris CENA357]